MAKTNTHKTREEWQIIVNESISDTDFQYLCRDILRMQKGFRKADLRGKGADGGRDIEAEVDDKLPNGDPIVQYCWVSCKNQKKGVGWDEDILKDYSRAKLDGIDRFIIMSVSDTTPDCKDTIKKSNKTERCQIVDWTGQKFLETLASLPDLAKFYLHEEVHLPNLISEKPADILPFSQKTGMQLGIQLQLKVDRPLNMNNMDEVAQFLKDKLLEIKDIDLGLKATLYEKISVMFMNLGKNEDALYLLDEALKITPNSETTLLLKGYIYAATFNLKKSNEIFDRVLTLNPRNMFALNNKANNLMAKGELKEAMEEIEKSLKIDPNFMLAIRTKAEILKLDGREREALEFLESKKSLVEKSILLKITKVDVLASRLDLKTAFELNEEILKTVPNYIYAVNQKGVLYEKNARYMESDTAKNKYLTLAMKCFEDTLKINKRFELGWSNRAVIMLIGGKTDEAKKILDSAIIDLPFFPQYWNKLGVYYLDKKEFKKALECFDSALKLVYEDEFITNKMRTLIELKKYGEVVGLSEICLRKDTKNELIWFLRANAFEHLKKHSHSKYCLRRAEKLHKDPVSLLE